MTGPVLLIDIWSGFSGASIAMLSLGVKIYVLAAEINPDVTKMAAASLDQAVHVPAEELINARMVEGIMKKRSIQAIVVGGGSPCQGNTSLNKSRELNDPRSLQPKELVRIKDELKRTYPKTPVLTFLENVASSPQQVNEEYDQLMGVQPIRIDAGIFRMGAAEASLLGLWPTRRERSVADSCPPRWRQADVGQGQADVHDQLRG